MEGGGGRENKRHRRANQLRKADFSVEDDRRTPSLSQPPLSRHGPRTIASLRPKPRRWTHLADPRTPPALPLSPTPPSLPSSHLSIQRVSSPPPRPASADVSGAFNAPRRSRQAHQSGVLLEHRAERDRLRGDGRKGAKGGGDRVSGALGGPRGRGGEGGRARGVGGEPWAPGASAPVAEGEPIADGW